MIRYSFIVLFLLLAALLWYYMRYYKPVKIILENTGVIIGLYESFFYNRLDYKELDKIIRKAFNDNPTEEELIIRSQKDDYIGEIELYKTDDAKEVIDGFNELIEDTIALAEKYQYLLDESELIEDEIGKVVEIQSKIRVAMWKQHNN